MEIEPYVLLLNEDEDEIHPVPVKDLRLAFGCEEDNAGEWRAWTDDICAEAFCRYDGSRIKTREIKAGSLEEFWLKLETAGFVYGGEEEES